MEPKRGFYDNPIATLDFSSLYPSIMMAHNLCYSTLVSESAKKKYNLLDSDVHKTFLETQPMFINNNKRKGVLSIILEELIQHRDAVKKEMKTEKDPFKYAILDGKQLALKVTANSLYGFTGATVGKLPCFSISASVTSYGRNGLAFLKAMIHKPSCVLCHCEINCYEKLTFSGECQDVVHDKCFIKWSENNKEKCPVCNNDSSYNKPNEFKPKFVEFTEEELKITTTALVVYGDTDSVMVKLNCDISTAQTIGLKMAKEATMRMNLHPIRLEFEKVYFPFLLVNKKRYVGGYWTKPNKMDKIDVKGLETVRRDSSLLTAEVMKDVIEKLIITKDKEGAYQLVCDRIREIKENKMDLSKFILSRNYGKNRSEYKNPPAYIAVVEDMTKRGFQFSKGQRIPYVVIRGLKGDKVIDRVAHPMRVLNEDLSIAVDDYIDDLAKCLSRIFAFNFGNDKKKAYLALINGEHTKHIKQVIPNTNQGMLKFITKKKRCIKCKAVIIEDTNINDNNNKQEYIVCDNCKQHEQENLLNLFLDLQQQQRKKEELYSKCWTQCQDCANTLLKPIDCVNMDCPIFFKRTTVIKELNEITQKLKSFEDLF